MDKKFCCLILYQCNFYHLVHLLHSPRELPTFVDYVTTFVWWSPLNIYFSFRYEVVCHQRTIGCHCWRVETLLCFQSGCAGIWNCKQKAAIKLEPSSTRLNCNKPVHHNKDSSACGCVYYCTHFDPKPVPLVIYLHINGSSEYKLLHICGDRHKFGKYL